jgi:hypothetical protein
MTIPSEGGKRRASRLPTEIGGSLTGRCVEPVRVLDLSPRGCLVRCSAHPEPGSIRDLTIELEGAPMSAKVRVAQTSRDGGWVDSADVRYLAGLEFLSLPADDEARLLRFLEAARRRRCAPDR